MKKLKSLTLGFGLISFMLFGVSTLNAKCGDAKVAPKAMKCGVGKCGDGKTKMPKGMKCGAGKCGGAMKKATEKSIKETNATKKETPKSAKCGVGKCG